MPVGEPAADRPERARACEEILKSRTFVRAGQLVHFLRFICILEPEGCAR